MLVSSVLILAGKNVLVTGPVHGTQERKRPKAVKASQMTGLLSWDKSEKSETVSQIISATQRTQGRNHKGTAYVTSRAIGGVPPVIVKMKAPLLKPTVV